MSVGETVAVFVSIILGIALGDLLLSTHRLLRARERVEWHWVTPALAFFMLMNVIAFWWASFSWYRELGDFSIGAFLPDVALFVLLFLGVAAVMPDENPGRPLFAPGLLLSRDALLPVASDSHGDCDHRPRVSAGASRRLGRVSEGGSEEHRITRVARPASGDEARVDPLFRDRHHHGDGWQ
jgi:hypothetical protein